MFEASKNTTSRFNKGKQSKTEFKPSLQRFISALSQNTLLLIMIYQT